MALKYSKQSAHVSRYFLLGCLLAAFSSVTTAGEFRSSRGHTLWVPKGVAVGRLQGVFLCSNYAAARKAYKHKAWCDLAARYHMGIMRYNGWGSVKADGVHRTPFSTMTEAIQEMATDSGYTELTRIPLAFMGVSAAGSWLISYGATPEVRRRTLANVAFHGNSISVCKPDATIPVLYAEASGDKAARNKSIDHHARDRFRARDGMPWTTIMQYGCRHNSIGDQAIVTAWMETVIKMRLAKGPRLAAVTFDKAVNANYSLTRSKAFTNVTIQPTYTARSRAIWLPNPGFAAVWWRAHGSKISISGRERPVPQNAVTVSVENGTDFGRVARGAAGAPVTFTIKNSGRDSLILPAEQAVRVSGDHASDFVVSGPTTDPLAPKGSRTFSVTFKPTGAGARSAKVTVFSNDYCAKAYSFAVKGNGRK